MINREQDVEILKKVFGLDVYGYFPCYYNEDNEYWTIANPSTWPYYGNRDKQPLFLHPSACFEENHQNLREAIEKIKKEQPNITITDESIGEHFTYCFSVVPSFSNDLTEIDPIFDEALRLNGYKYTLFFKDNLKKSLA